MHIHSWTFPRCCLLLVFSTRIWSLYLYDRHNSATTGITTILLVLLVLLVVAVMSLNVSSKAEERQQFLWELVLLTLIKFDIFDIWWSMIFDGSFCLVVSHAGLIYRGGTWAILDILLTFFIQEWKVSFRQTSKLRPVKQWQNQKSKWISIDYSFASHCYYWKIVSTTTRIDENFHHYHYWTYRNTIHTHTHCRIKQIKPCHRRRRRKQQ